MWHICLNQYVTYIIRFFSDLYQLPLEDRVLNDLNRLGRSIRFHVQTCNMFIQIQNLIII